MNTEIYNVEDLNNARDAFGNSGWQDRFDNDNIGNVVARFIRDNCSADFISRNELNELISRFIAENLNIDISDFE
jgi:hypothetical protein